MKLIKYLFANGERTLFTKNPKINFAQKQSAINLNQNFKRFCHHSQNATSSYKIEEITFPNGLNNYQIACKVWKGTGTIDKNKIKEDEPPIICIHGWLDNACSFDTLIPKIIRPGRTFYAFDLPGHGLSSHIQSSHYNNHVEAHLEIHRVVRHLKLDKFSLLGHSMGAEAGIMYAGTFPKGVHKIITMDGVNPKIPNWVHSVQVFVSSLFEIEEILKKSPKPGPSDYDELIKRMVIAREGMTSAEGCKILLRRGAEKFPGDEGKEKFRFTHDPRLKIPPGMGMMSTEQMSQFFQAVEAPICFIKSAKNERFSDQASKDFQTAMEMAKLENKDLHVEYHKVEGGHHVHLEDPEKVSEIISKFLDS